MIASGRRIVLLPAFRKTRAQLAGAAGATQPAAARFEAGGTSPPFPLIERLARALGVELVVKFDGRSGAARPDRTASASRGSDAPPGTNGEEPGPTAVDRAPRTERMTGLEPATLTLAR
ncbi:helix-turn-helix domain-containing protein [Saccharopolyspora griseoalba]|uniref:Helix-turn-helix domain-containing protein n=1 Tax=Saccharopolyspora griseoalba TaxID=1431848 RepID=A0ABW2LMC6_9PSEU